MIDSQSACPRGRRRPSWAPHVAEANSRALLARTRVAIQRRHAPSSVGARIGNHSSEAGRASIGDTRAGMDAASRLELADQTNFRLTISANVANDAGAAIVFVFI